MRQQATQRVALTTFMSSILLLAVVVFGFMMLSGNASAQVTNPQQGSIGVSGTIPSDPPAVAPTITVPSSGQTFTNLPITLSGICTPDLEVRVYRNEVFAGSVVCTPAGTYTIQIDLFTGTNTLVARVFDALGQPGPDSNITTVDYQIPGGEDGVEDLLLTSNFSTRGADPNTVLRWPITISGGVGPYAFSIDWGDGVTEPLSIAEAGLFNLEHTYTQPGVYKLIVKATDSRGETAFIQLIAVANGSLAVEDTSETAPETLVTNTIQTETTNRYLLWFVYLLIFFIVSTFWLGRRYERRRIKEKLYNREGIKF